MYYGSYKYPRELNWILGCVIYVLMTATAFLGYTLPWGQMSYWGATVITNLFSVIPIVGEGLKTWLLGDYTVGNATLNRFFALHYVLPFVIFGVVGLHVAAVHVHGSNNPSGISIKSKKDTVSFFPYMLIKDTVAVCVFGVIISAVIFFGPNIMAEVDNYIPADPLVTPAHIVPNWYLAPFYAILRAIPSKLGGVIFMFAAIFILMLLPWLDTSKVRSAIFRPIYKKFFWVLVFVVILLGYLGAKPPEGIYLILSRLATAYYFIHFLILLPFLGRYEKTDPLPQSISDPVLNKPGMLDKFKNVAAKYEGELACKMLQKKYSNNWYSTFSYSNSVSISDDPREDRNGTYSRTYDYGQVMTFIGGYKLHFRQYGWYNAIRDDKILKNLLYLPIMPSDIFEISFRYRYMGGRPYTERHYEPTFRRWSYDSEWNIERYNYYSRLDIMFLRRFNFNKINLITFLDIQNVFNKNNDWEYVYLPDGSKEMSYQYKQLPIGGITIEF